MKNHDLDCIRAFVNWMVTEYRTSETSTEDIKDMAEMTLDNVNNLIEEIKQQKELIHKINQQNLRLNNEIKVLSSFKFHAVSSMTDKQLKKVIEKVTA
jgi:translation initiation factor 2B subunit (eIF-2B alpha/beta/delta family)